jgi:GGDEF domain-containing protein
MMSSWRIARTQGALWRARAVLVTPTTKGPLVEARGQTAVPHRGYIGRPPTATIEQGRDIVDRMRLATPLGQTFSAGVAGWNGTDTSEEQTARADAALYLAKNAGRNQIAVAEPHAVPA